MATLPSRRAGGHPVLAYAGIALAAVGLAAMVVSLFLPLTWLFPKPWSVEPLSYVGIAAVVVGLAIAVAAYVGAGGRRGNGNGSQRRG